MPGDRPCRLTSCRNAAWLSFYSFRLGSAPQREVAPSLPYTVMGNVLARFSMFLIGSVSIPVIPCGYTTCLEALWS